MRDKRRGYPAVVKIGYKKSNNKREKPGVMKPVLIMNIKDIKKMGKGEVGIVGKIGKKKKTEIVKIAQENKIPLCNIKIEKFLKRNKQQAKKEERK